MPRLHIEFRDDDKNLPIAEQISRQGFIYDATAMEQMDMQWIADSLVVLLKERIIERRAYERGVQKLIRRITKFVRERKYQA